ncbi:MAG TPA: cyclic nucleotide-binding domain-containing protein [Mariprofundaceae bacterium]|nr:cyclic nucleotide-binding domain-containing protein [Mariprofundaceae bacterium]
MNLRHELLTIAPATFEALISKGTEKRYEAGARLPGLEQGFDGIRLIEAGSIAVLAEVEKKQVPVYEYEAGEALGVRAMLLPDNKPAIVWQAVSDATVIELDHDTVREILDHDDGQLRALFERAAHLRDLEILLAVHPLFHTLPQKERNRLFELSQPKSIAPGERLIERGKINDSLYLITHGSLDIVKNGQVVASKQTGDVLGEISALGFAPTADAVASGWTEVLAFNREHIMKSCEDYPEFAGAIGSIGLTGIMG